MGEIFYLLLAREVNVRQVVVIWWQVIYSTVYRQGHVEYIAVFLHFLTEAVYPVNATPVDTIIHITVYLVAQSRHTSIRG